MRTGLELADSYDADAGPFCQFLLAPIEEAASGPTLRGRDHLLRFAHATEIINSVKKRLTRSCIFYNHKHQFSMDTREEFHENQAERFHESGFDRAGPPLLYRRVRRTNHHEPRRGGADPALERKARRGRAGGPVGQSY